MKILAFTDIHGNYRIINKILKNIKQNDPDVVICSGDITEFGFNLKAIIKRFENINRPFIIIPGNHEDEYELKNICKEIKNCVYLHKGMYKINEFLFLGHGGGGFSLIDKDFEKISNEFKKNISKSDKIVFVTHAPIHGTKTDYLEGLGHQGNKSYRKFIEEIQPIIAICGHFHENENKSDKIKRTLIINPGKIGRIIEL